MKRLIFALNILVIMITYDCYAVYFKLGEYQSGGRIVSLDIKGDFVFTAKYDGLMEIIDVSDPEQPQLVASLQLPDHIPGVVGRIVVSDTLVFVLGHSNIHIVTITNPSNPLYAGRLNYSKASDIIIIRNLAYITGNFGLKIFDISNIQAPQQLGSFYSDMSGICLHDTLIYGVRPSGPNNLYIINVADPQNPVLVNNDLNIDVYSSADIGFYEFHVFIACSNNFWSINVNDPNNPLIVDTLWVETGADKIHIQNNKAIINNSYSGFKVIDISYPTHLSTWGYYDTPGLVEQVVSNNTIAFVASGYSGLQIIDISDYTNPYLVGTFQTFGLAQGLDIFNNYVYLADGKIGLDVIDISDVNRPVLSGTFFSGIGMADNVSVHDNNLCFSRCYPSPELLFIDISNPDNPLLLHQVNLSGSVLYGSIALFQTDTQVFVGVRDTLRIYDVTDFSNPVIIAQYAATNQITDIVIEGDKGYISTGENGIEIIDLKNINLPQFLSSYNTTGTAVQIAVQSGVLAIADGKSGLEILDVSNPMSPYSIESIKPHYNSNILAKPVIVGNKIVITDNEWNEIFTYDVGDVNNIHLLTSLKLNSEIYKFIYHSEYFLCSINCYGMIILKSSSILSLNENEANLEIKNDFTIFPNPFYNSTSVNYTIRERSKVIIEIYNLEGNDIKSLLNNYENEGSYYVNWDGTDNNGYDVPAGFYLIQIRYGKNTENHQVVIKNN